MIIGGLVLIAGVVVVSRASIATWGELSVYRDAVVHLVQISEIRGAMDGLADGVRRTG
jgi:hypothetical protein